MGACLFTSTEVDLTDDDSFDDRYFSESSMGESAFPQKKITGIHSKRHQKSLDGFDSFRISKIEFPGNSSLGFGKSFFSNGNFLSASPSSMMLLREMTTRRQLPITEVTSQIFLGSFENAKDEKKLNDLGITHIISLIGPKHPVEGIKLKHKPMSDYGRTDLKKVVKLLWPFIIESQKVCNKLFVHCQSGQNRSATLVIAILMKLKYGHHGDNKLIDAYAMVKRKRPIVQIIEKYAKQLSNLESELFGTTTMPANWMRIESYCMDTGKVVFQGERLGLERNLQNRASQDQIWYPNKIHNMGIPQYRAVRSNSSRTL